MGQWARGYASERGCGVQGEVLLALAQWAGQTVATAAVTDVWESVRGRFARLDADTFGQQRAVGRRVKWPNV